MKSTAIKKSVSCAASAPPEIQTHKKTKISVSILSRKMLLTAAKYAILALALFALSNASVYGIRPFGAAFYFALIFLNLSFFIITPIFLMAELVGGGIFGLFSAVIIAALFGGAWYLKQKLKEKKKNTRWIWFCVPLVASGAVAAFMTFTEFNILHIALYAFLIFTAVQAARVALRPILIEKLKYRMLEVEVVCLAGLAIAAGVGFSAFALWGFPLGVFVAAYCVFVAAKTAASAKGVLVGLLFGLGHAIQAFDPTILAAYALFSVLAAAFASAPKILMPLSAMAGYLIFAFFFFDETTYVVLWVSAFAAAGLLYMLTPGSVLKTFKDYLFETHDKTAVRYMIQRDRQELAKRLHSAAGVFGAMSYTLQHSERKPPEYAGSLANKCCALCEHDKICNKSASRNEALDAMLNTVFEKGRAQLADIPDYLARQCKNLANLMASAGSIAETRARVLAELSTEKNSRAIVAHQMVGMSGVLNDLAGATETAVNMDLAREKVLVEELNYATVAASQALIAKDIVTLILRTETYDRALIERVVSRVSHKSHKIVSIDDTLLAGFSCVNLAPRPACDVVFGVAGAAKKKDELSGDAHSFIKIGQNRFMMALSDGMGSGAGAAEQSGTALGLVENFYRAGFSGELVLKSVNRFLAGTGGESFSALDICVIDLDSLACDVVKLASPATYIKRDDMVERIDGSGAPMGVLEHIEPASLRLALQPGDMVVLASDGVDESFSGDKLSAAINNLRTKNPQTLAEGILEYALHNNGGKLRDDSTVLVARVIPNL